MDNFPQIAKEYIETNQSLMSNQKNSLFLVRPDGVPIYHQSHFVSGIDESSIGALLGGIWQAAKALASFIPDSDDCDEFRLSFDTSSKGVYILPVKVGDVEYYLGIIYSDEMNPGLIKSRLRKFVDKFIKYTEEHITIRDETISNETKEDALFNNITDDEMDQLFSF